MRWGFVESSPPVEWADMEVEQRKGLKQGIDKALGETSLLPTQSYFRALGQKLQRADLRPDGLNQTAWRALVERAHASYMDDMERVKRVVTTADLSTDGALDVIDAEEKAEIEVASRADAQAIASKYVETLEDETLLESLSADDRTRIQEQADASEEPIDVDALLLARAKQTVFAAKAQQGFEPLLAERLAAREAELAELTNEQQAERLEDAKATVLVRKLALMVKNAKGRLPGCTIITDDDIMEAHRRFPPVVTEVEEAVNPLDDEPEEEL